MLKHLHKNFKKPDGHENIFIFIHGFGSSSCTKEFDATHPQIISALQEFSKGCGILTFDFIGHGKSVHKNDEANFNITPLNEISNLHEIFSFVTTQHPKSEIIPICASHGALVLSLFLDKYPIFTSSIKKIIAWYPCLQYENIFYTKQKESIIPLIPGSQELSVKMQKEFSHNRNFNPWGNFYITLDFYKNIEKYNSSFFANTAIPTLILHGNKDEIIPICYSKKIAGNNKNITLKIINNASHSFEKNIYKKEVIKQSLDFLL